MNLLLITAYKKLMVIDIDFFSVIEDIWSNYGAFRVLFFHAFKLMVFHNFQFMVAFTLCSYSVSSVVMQSGQYLTFSNLWGEGAGRK